VLLKDRIKNKVVLDVGSRLGAVLYAVSRFAFKPYHAIKWRHMSLKREYKLILAMCCCLVGPFVHGR